MALSSTQPTERARCEATIDILLVGSWDAGEFAELLPTIAASSSWQRASVCVEAVELLSEGEFVPELILLADPQPDTFSSAEVELLRQAAPLARLVVVAGTWCEGELRTGAPLAGVLRLYWYEFSGWWASALETMEQGACPPWSHPLAGPAGRCIDAQQAEIAGIVAVDCKSIATFEAIADAMSSFGADCYWTRRGEIGDLPAPMVAGIWDGGQLEPLEVERLSTFSQAIRERGGIVVALLDFPRREHLEITLAAGCHAVFGKPYIVSELVSRITGLT